MCIYHELSLRKFIIHNIIGWQVFLPRKDVQWLVNEKKP